MQEQRMSCVVLMDYERWHLESESPLFVLECMESKSNGYGIEEGRYPLSLLTEVFLKSQKPLATVSPNKLGKNICLGDTMLEG